MTGEQKTGWGIAFLALLLLWLLNRSGLLHSTTEIVQSRIAVEGGQENEPTVTTSCCG